MDEPSDDAVKLEYAASVIAALSKPFPPEDIATRTDKVTSSGKPMRYLEFMTVVGRLNEAAPNWSSSHVEQEPWMFGNTSKGEARVLLRADATIYIPGVGSRSHRGVAVVNAYNGGEDLWKGAISDAIKKAASLFGVGRELYEDPAPEDVSDGPLQARVQQGRSQPPAQTRPAGGGGVSDKQFQMLISLAYERGFAYADYSDAQQSSTSQEVSAAITKLKAMPKVNELKWGEKPPDEWYGVPF